MFESAEQPAHQPGLGARKRREFSRSLSTFVFAYYLFDRHETLKQKRAFMNRPGVCGCFGSESDPNRLAAIFSWQEDTGHHDEKEETAFA